VTAPERPAHERILIEGEWLVEDVGVHTCGAGGEWPHEPGCGLVPLMPVAALDEQMRARSRFAARIVGPGPIPGSRVVEVYAGERYEYPTGRGGLRAPRGQLLLDEEQAADLIEALGEPDPLELPERLRPRPESWPL
jgi:hypothetical protein